MLKSSPHFVGLVICIGSYKDRESLSDNMFVIAIALLQLANLQNQQKRMFMEESSDMLLVFFLFYKEKMDWWTNVHICKHWEWNSISTEMTLKKSANKYWIERYFRKESVDHKNHKVCLILNYPIFSFLIFQVRLWD